MSDEFRIEDVIVQRYQPQDGDVLFVKLPDGSGPTEIKRVEMFLGRKLPTVKVLAYSGDVELLVVRVGAMERTLKQIATDPFLNPEDNAALAESALRAEQ